MALAVQPFFCPGENMFTDNRIEIEKLIEDEEIKEPARKYLGLSGIGHPCARAIFYSFRLYLPPRILTPREARLYRRGHNEEPIIINDLEKVGVKIISTQDECSDCEGHVKGHLDSKMIGVPPYQKTQMLGEFKTSKTKYFDALTRSQSVEKSFNSHYAQAQSYMYKFKLKYCLYVCVNKEDDRRYYEIIPLNKAYAKDLLAKATDIVLSTFPPIKLSEQPSYYRCGPKWCEYRNICHFNAIDKINRSCRSCRFAEVHDKARWKCSKKKKFLSWKKQQEGCGKWKLLKS